MLIHGQEEGSTITKVCSMSWVFSDVIMEKALKYDQGISNPVTTDDERQCFQKWADNRFQKYKNDQLSSSMSSAWNLVEHAAIVFSGVPACLPIQQMQVQIWAWGNPHWYNWFTYQNNLGLLTVQDSLHCYSIEDIQSGVRAGTGN